MAAVEVVGKARHTHAEDQQCRYPDGNEGQGVGDGKPEGTGRDDRLIVAEAYKTGGADALKEGKVEREDKRDEEQRCKAYKARYQQPQAAGIAPHGMHLLGIKWPTSTPRRTAEADHFAVSVSPFLGGAVTFI